MRGKQNLLTATYSENRITPAGAGKTNTLLIPKVKHQDHPRRCGENAPQGAGIIPLMGSPPQVRGKLTDSALLARLKRITPADAGKTHLIGINQSLCWVHPRGCGENRESKQQARREMGSPPRMRGKPSGITGVTTEKRITPADAGKTFELFHFQPPI